GPWGWGEGAGGEGGDSPGRRAHVRSEGVVEVLEDLEVGERGRQVEGRGGRDRAAHVVRRDQNVVRLAPSRELSRLGDPAHHREVRLDDVRGAALEDLAELVPDVDALARRD